MTTQLLPLRDYQSDGLSKIYDQFDQGLQRVAAVLPTGGGKTVLFGHIAADFVDTDRDRRKVLILAHRDELVSQAARKVKSIAPHLPVGIVKAERDDTWAPAVVASVQTLRSAARRGRLRGVGLIIVDECHHATAKSYTDILEHYGAFDESSGVRALGVTATLARSDRGKLGDVWQTAVVIETMLGLIRRGYLLDPVGKRIEIPELDLSGVRRSRGDYQDGDLGRAMIAGLAPDVIAKAYREHCPDDHGVMFWPTVEAAQAGADAMNALGIPTKAVWGAQPIEERRRILRAADAGDVQILSNCMVFTEGFDWPRARVCVIARPTQSAPLYQQMAGRVLRPFPGQTQALLLDAVGASYQHSLASLVDLARSGDEEADEGQPEFILPPLDGESLLEAAERSARARDDRDEVMLYQGATVARIFDPLAEQRRVWSTTRAGNRFLSCTDRYLFLVPSTARDAAPGTWDVCWAAADKPIDGKFGDFLERGVEMGYAAAWAEQHVEELERNHKSRSHTTKKSRWRNDAPSDAQLRLAARFGIRPEGSIRAGALSELIDTAKATPTVDAFVRRILGK